MKKEKIKLTNCTKCGAEVTGNKCDCSNMESPITHKPDELLPCPFCGSPAERLKSQDLVYCSNVKCFMIDAGEISAEAWNTRHPRKQKLDVEEIAKIIIGFIAGKIVQEHNLNRELLGWMN